MKNAISKYTMSAMVGGLLVFTPLLSAWADADDKPAAPVTEPAVSRNNNGEMVVTIDEATQKRIKLEVARPVSAAWKPEAIGYGTVVDPASMATAVVDLATARLNAQASARELERTKTLAAQENASARVLETAQGAKERDRLALAALQAKFVGDWGPSLAGRGDLSELVQQLTGRTNSLVRLILPGGMPLATPPAGVAVTVFPDDNELIPAEVLESALGVDPQTQGQILLVLVKDHALPLNAAVTGHLSLEKEPVAGVMIPAAAVLRHEGLAWVYVQTADDKFTRHQIPVSHLTAEGWFVPAGLSPTNSIVTGAAATVLSAELSGGGFNTGERD
jgi:hypothetical protein